MAARVSKPTYIDAFHKFVFGHVKSGLAGSSYRISVVGHFCYGVR